MRCEHPAGDVDAAAGTLHGLVSRPKSDVRRVVLRLWFERQQTPQFLCELDAVGAGAVEQVDRLTVRVRRRPGPGPHGVTTSPALMAAWTAELVAAIVRFFVRSSCAEARNSSALPRYCLACEIETGLVRGDRLANSPNLRSDSFEAVEIGSEDDDAVSSDVPPDRALRP